MLKRRLCRVLWYSYSFEVSEGEPKIVLEHKLFLQFYQVCIFVVFEIVVSCPFILQLRVFKGVGGRLFQYIIYSLLIT